MVRSDNSGVKVKTKSNFAVSILLALLIAMQTILLLGHQCSLFFHKIAMDWSVEKSMTQDILSFSTSEFEKVRINNRELLIGGQYFDIIKKEINGDTVTVYGIYDHREKELKNQIAGKMEQKAAQRLSLLFKFIYLSAENTGLDLVMSPPSKTARSHFYFDFSLPDGAFRGVFKPPLS